MLRVLTLVPHPVSGASSRYRAYQFADPLARLGVELDIRPFLDDRGYANLHRSGGVVSKAMEIGRGVGRRRRDLRDASGFPLVLVHREVCPLAPLALERRLARSGVPWVYDLDDAVFLPNASDENRLFSWLKPFAQLADLAAGARAVSAGNAWLAEWARGVRPGRPADEVELIPTAVDIERWRPRPRAEGPLRLVWLGSPWTQPLLEPIRPALDRLSRLHPAPELHVIGARFRQERLPVVNHPWSYETEVDLTGRCDIGLAPLSDTPWNRGKCGLKLLLYMALGLPVVASRVGANAEIVSHGENGLLAEDVAGFEEAIAALLSDAALRERLGQAGRRTVEERYSIGAVAPRLAALLRRAARE